MRKILQSVAVAMFCAHLWAQGSRYDSAVLTSANNSPFGSQAQVYTVPFAYLKVCAYPATGNPCTNVVNIYSDPGLTQPITQPFQADNHGRFGFWAAPGQYSYNAQSVGGTNYGQFTITLAGTGGGSATFPSNPGIVYSLNTSTARNATSADVVGLWTSCTGTMNLRADGTCANASGALSLTTTGTAGLATLASNVLNIPNYTLTTAGVTALGTLTNDTSGSAAKIGGVAVSGVPGVGQVPVALSSSTASWQTLAGVPGGSNTQMQFNNSGAFGGSNLTWDGTTLGMTTGKQFFGNGTHDVGTIYDYEFDNNGATLAGTTFENAAEVTYQPNYSADVSTTSSSTAFIANTNALSNHQLGKLVGVGAGTALLGNGNFNEARGIDASAGMLGNGSGNSLFGSDASYGNLGTGTITNAYAYMAQPPQGAGIIQHTYGVYIQDQTGGTISSYNLYSAGATTHNMFEGSLTIGGDVGMATGKVLNWNSDTGISRFAARAIAVGNGTAGDATGSVEAAGILLSYPAGGLFTGPAVDIRTSVAATNVANNPPSTISFTGNYWNGSASATDGWLIDQSFGTGANPTSQLQLSHVGGGTSGVSSVAFALQAPLTVYSAAGTALPSCAVGTNGFQAVVSDATAPTYMGAYTSGGTITAAVICSFNGSAYSWVTH